MSGQDPELDQDARIALLNNYSTMCLYWGAYLTSFAVVLFSVVQARQYISPIGLFRLLLSSVIAQMLFAGLRILWYGQLTEHVLDADPSPPRRCSEPYILRLHRRARNCVEGKRRWGIPYGRILFWSNYPWFWLLWTIGVTFVISFAWCPIASLLTSIVNSFDKYLCF